MALFLGALWLCSCDLIVDKIREGGNTRPDNGSSGGGSSAGPVAPPSSDAGMSTVCRSTAECGAGLTCSTEWGVCNPPAGCRPGNACPAVCSGFCETSKPAPTPVPDPAPPRCRDTVLAGDETTCKSQEEWKLHAYQACQAQNLTLNAYSVGGGDCAPGKTHQVKYQCCGQLPPDPGNSGSGSGSGGSSGSTPGTGTPGTGTPGTGTPGSPGTCSGGSDGSDTSCKSIASWREYAIEACARQNQSLTEIAYADNCGPELYRYMKFVCCSAAN